MKRLKVMTVVGTRPEIIRLSRVIAKLDQHCDHCLVHTGQSYDYELSRIFFEELSIRQPDFHLDVAGATPAATIAAIIEKADRVIAQVAPEAMLVLGDTNSCLSVIAAKRRKVPTFHMEAGNRCFDMRVPEEINRRIVDHTSDVNLTYSDIARERLIAEGLPPDLVIKTGSPMAEVLGHYRDHIDASDVLQRLELSPEGYFVVSAHREENVDSDARFASLSAILDRVAETSGLPVIVSTHPRTRRKVEAATSAFHPRVRFLTPLGFPDYVALQSHARAVLSDSGTISEESNILNFPALNLRDTQERHEAFEEGAVMMTGLNPDRVMQGLAILESQPRGEDRLLRVVSDYDTHNVSDKVVRIVHSFTDYVDRVVWKKY